MKLVITLDLCVAYLQLSDKQVAQTVEVGPSLLVDLDELDVARGIEILDLSTPITSREVDDLFRCCHFSGEHQSVVRDALTSALQNLPRFRARSSQTKVGTDAVSANRANNFQVNRLADC